MSYIIKKTSPLVNVKLTDLGRKSLANGNLTFKQFGLGDSEVDYLTHDSSTSWILRPVDNNPDLMYPVPNQGSNYLVPITNLNAIPREIKQSATERGLFNNKESAHRQLNTSLLTQGPFSFSSVSNDTASITKVGGVITNQPHVGDTLILKTGYTTTVSSGATNDFDKGQVVLQYTITDVLTTGSTVVSVKVDRIFPLFTGQQNWRGYVYTKNLIESLDHTYPTTYWDNSVLGFELNGVTTYDDVPMWNFNLVLIDDMIGVDPTIDKNATQTKGKRLLGSSILFKEYEEAKLDKIGIVHYTNNSVSNWYGEGFYRNTFSLDLPTVMWHKKQGGGPGLTTGLGYTFICGNELKVLSGKIRYYDLVDQEKMPTIVGKVFIDYKVAVIEDAELLMAMSIKSNRNWSLPTPRLTLIEPGTCYGSNTLGALKAGEALHVTYLFTDSNLKTVHCNNVTTIEIGDLTPKDIVFEFPKDSTNPLYSEFGYLRDYPSTDTEGFKVKEIHMIWQKTTGGERPTSEKWNKKDITPYLLTNGCIEEGCGGDIVSRTQKYTVGTNLSSNNILCDLKPENDIVYVYFNGTKVSPNAYTLVANPGDVNKPYVNITTLPTAGTEVKIYYVVDTAVTAVSDAQLSAGNIHNLKVFVDYDFLDNSKNNPYILRDYINIPDISTDEVSFGDEDFLLGNVLTDIKATVYKSVMTCNVLPNQFVTSSNPTWNANQDKVQYSEIGIYDEDNDLVAIGKFSQPLKRKYNSDILVIQATIDF